MPGQSRHIPAFIIAALRGGSGKTVISIGIISALASKGHVVSPFKKGPDYIDAGWLSMAAGRPCHNLDTYLIPFPHVIRSFYENASNSDIALIEGNRGLFDGLDVEGTTSTAQLARDLGLPVILCIDCTKSTRTMAALVKGCQVFDPDLVIGGVILNRVAGARHESLVRQCIETHCGIPVIGAIGKLSGNDFPERHMGLVPTPEHDWAASSIDTARRHAENCIDLDAVIQIAKTGAVSIPESVFLNLSSQEASSTVYPLSRPVIGVVRDAAFQFYYPENLDALKAAGAELVFISPLSDRLFPDVDALYIGGGFPETHARRLSENRSFMEGVKVAAESGMPIYAECGGLIYLGEALQLDRRYPMTGVFPVTFGFSRKPKGHGYTHAIVTGKNPFFPEGSELQGHEFHYSSLINDGKGPLPDMAFSLVKGKGVIDKKDGMVKKNVLACYTHIHALGNPGWAPAMVNAAHDYRKQRKTACRGLPSS